MLKRIWEEGAYGAAPVADCWWADTVPPGDWPALEGDTTTDVAIIGAGFTGLNAALGLAEAGVGVTELAVDQAQPGGDGLDRQLRGVAGDLDIGQAGLGRAGQGDGREGGRGAGQPGSVSRPATRTRPAGVAASSSGPTGPSRVR